MRFLTITIINRFIFSALIKMNEGTPKQQHLQSTPRRTPISQQRPYLSFHQTQGKSRPQVHPYHHSETPHMIEQIYDQEPEEQQNLIWGTNISTESVIKQLGHFFMQFQVMTQEESPAQRVYMTQLQDYDLDLLDKNLFQINGKHLKEWDSDLYYQLIYYPAQIITIMDQVIKNLYQQQFIDPIEREDESSIETKEHKKDLLMVSIQHLGEISLMRSLEQKHINRLICFRGIVIRCSDIYPEMKAAVFQCLRCKAEVPINLIDAKVQEPKACTNCKQKDTFEIVHKYCNFTDKQYVKLQQLPEYVPEGQTPTSMNILCYDNNVNGMRPGDRVEIVGLYRCQPRKITRSRATLESIFYTFTDIISFRTLQENRFKASLSDCKTLFSEDDVEKFIEIAKSQNVIDDLVQSFAPSISGHQNIKKGLLTQIFGGSHKQFQGRGRFRSDINICLVGDPSTAKSQMLKQVHSIAPRGIYTSGKGSSAVGLTASVRRDPETREFILQSGALVLSDLGICCIDEFDKMDENSKLILLQAMQQQTISVAKAGIVCQLNSRTSILSAANPIQSKYDMKRSVVENINLPPALLSRFDLIYIILDIPNEKTDRKLAQHILSLYSGKTAKQQNMLPKISRDLMAKYITYAREYIIPRLSEGAARKLTECYLEMRRAGSGRGTVSATPRQLESLIRISEAFAKMKLSNYVEEDDVLMSFQLIKEALQQSATDPTTGLIDMDIIVTGVTSASRKRVDSIIVLLKDHFQANASEFIGKKVSFDRITDDIISRWKQIDNQNRPKQQEVRQALLKLDKEGIINVFGNDKKRPMFKYIGQDIML